MTAPRAAATRPETWAANPPELFPPLPAEAYNPPPFHLCICPEHDCTKAVTCFAGKDCSSAHLCDECAGGCQ